MPSTGSAATCSPWPPRRWPPPWWRSTGASSGPRATSAGRRPATGRAERARIPQPGPLRPSPPRALRPEVVLPGGLQRLTGAGQLLLDGLEEVQAIAPDDDLVAVAQHAPLDALAVDEHAVEAPVVQDPHAIGLAHDQRVPARHGRVVEPDVGREAATDPRPLALERGDANAPAVHPREVLPRLGDHPARPGHQLTAFVRRRLLAGAALEARPREQRRPREPRAATPRAVRQRVGRGQRDDVAAFLAPERSGTRQGACRK